MSTQKKTESTVMNQRAVATYRVMFALIRCVSALIRGDIVCVRSYQALAYKTTYDHLLKASIRNCKTVEESLGITPLKDKVDDILRTLSDENIQKPATVGAKPDEPQRKEVAPPANSADAMSAGIDAGAQASKLEDPENKLDEWKAFAVRLFKTHVRLTTAPETESGVAAAINASHIGALRGEKVWGKDPRAQECTVHSDPRVRAIVRVRGGFCVARVRAAAHAPAFVKPSTVEIRTM